MPGPRPGSLRTLLAMLRSAATPTGGSAMGAPRTTTFAPLLLALVGAPAAADTIFHNDFEVSCIAADGDRPELWWQAASFAEGQVLTLHTNGQCAFGELGPELIFLMDLTRMAPGAIDIGRLVLCDACTLVGGADHEVATVPDMPGARGLVTGGVGDALNPTATPRFRVDHPAYTRGFDSRITYWPEANQQAALAYLRGEVPGYSGPTPWQIKPIWKMADADFGGGDTDFFLAGLYNWYGGSAGSYFLTGPTVSSNSVGTYYLPGGSVLAHPRGPEHARPFAEPYTIEYGWDQGSLTQAYDAFVDVNIATTARGGLYRHRRDEIRLHVVDAPTQAVNHFTYPGYIRGYSRTLGLHFYEGELYKTGGDGAFARVAISDHEDYFQAGRRTLLEPITWSDGEIQVRLREGWFDLSQPDGLFLNIIDANNQQVGSIRL